MALILNYVFENGAWVQDGTALDVSSLPYTIGTVVQDVGIVGDSAAIAAELGFEFPADASDPLDNNDLVNVEGELVVLSGGTTIDTTVDGGVESVENGGMADGTTVISGGNQEVTNGGTASGTTVSDGGNQYVYDGGFAGGAYIGSDSTQLVEVGGTASSTIVDGGTENVYGADYGTTVSDGGYLFNAGTASGTVVDNGGTLVNIATAIDAVVNSGGTLGISGGAVFSDTTTINFGGTLEVGEDSTISGFVVDDGVTVVLQDGGTVLDTVIDSGGTVRLDAFATISGIVVGDGATLDLDNSGPPVSGTEIDSGGTENISAPIATDIDATVSGVQNVYDGGFASGAYIGSGGVQSIDGESEQTFADGTEIGNGGIQNISGSISAGGFASNTVIDSGGVQNVDEGGYAIGTDNSGGTENVYGGDYGATVSGGGVQNVYAGGTDNGPAFVFGEDLAGTEIGSGGVQNVYDGGLVIATVIDNDGEQDVYSGGVASGTNNSGGTENVYGTDDDATVSGGGVQNVYAGGSAYGAEIGSDGEQDVRVGGTVGGTTVDGGGQLIVSSGGTTTATTLMGDDTGSGSPSAGYERLSGGTADDTAISNGGVLVISSGIANDTTVFNGGEQDVYGSALGTEVDGGGTDNVYGADNDATLGGGTQNVFLGATANGAVVDGGSQNVFAGGRATSTILKSGVLDVLSGGSVTGTDIVNGTEIVLFGGRSLATVINAGGFEFVSDGGTDINATINNGGEMIVSSGGTASGTTIHGGGTLVLESDAAAGRGSILFEGIGGTLAIGGSSMPANVVSGFAPGDVIDLNGVSFDSSGSAVLSSGNVLQVVENAQTYDLNFDSSQHFGSEQFELASDGNSGTDIILSEVAVSRGQTLNISAGQTISFIAVLSGGTADVLSGGTVSDTTILPGGTLELFGGAVIDGTLSIKSGGVAEIGTGYTLSGASIGSGVTLEVASGGTITSLTILAGGTFEVFGGALIGGKISIDSGGTAEIGPGYTLSGDTINSGTILEVASGGTISNTTILSGGTLELLGGAIVDGTISINPGATLEIGPGYSLSGAKAMNGVTLDVASNGTTSDTIVASGGTESVYGTDIGTVIDGGGSQHVYGGGVAIDTTVDALVSTGTQFVLSGGVASDTTIDANDTQEVESGGTASGISLLNGGTEQIDSGGTTHIYGGDTLNGAVVDNGELIFDLTTSGDTFAGTLTGSGTLVVEGGGTLVMGGGDSFTGAVTISSGTLELTSSTAVGSVPIAFAPAVDPTLQIDGTVMPSDAISGFTAASGDSIYLSGVTNVGGSHADLLAGDHLQITEGAVQYALNLDPNESYGYFYLATGSGGIGTVVTEGTVACYCRGTLIRTEDGEIAVEDLVIGDRVATMSGAPRPIKWIGTRSYSARFALGQEHILPICIKAGALDDAVPLRDLWISPHHAMYLGGVLIEARDLVNGVSIVQAERIDQVDYFHIELDEHDVIIAEGAFSESFVDDNSRGMFHNAHAYRELYPAAMTGPVRYFAPRHAEGYEVEAARCRIEQRAGLPLMVERPALRGYIDVAAGNRIAGWAQNPDHPGAPVCLDIFVGGELIGQVLANRYRADIFRAGIGSGRHSFDFRPPAGLAFAPEAVEVRRSLDGAPLPRSTHARRVAQPQPVFSAGAR